MGIIIFDLILDLLRIMGDIEEIENEIEDNNENDEDVSSKLSSDSNASYNTEIEELMFIQPHIHSQGEKQSVCSKNLILKTWILLDSQSTVDVISNGDLLTKIHQVKTTLRIRCNAGMKTTNFRGHLSGYGWVWFYPDGIANILSLSRVKDKYRVTFDSATDNCFRVHKDNGKILKFQEATKRLYYFDTVDRDVEETMLITTVDDNKNQVSAHDYSRANIVRALQRRIDRPTAKRIIHYVGENLIPNCPITVHDIKYDEFIWGPELGALKGKTTRQKSPQPM